MSVDVANWQHTEVNISTKISILMGCEMVPLLLEPSTHVIQSKPIYLRVRSGWHRVCMALHRWLTCSILTFLDRIAIFKLNKHAVAIHCKWEGLMHLHFSCTKSGNPNPHLITPI